MIMRQPLIASLLSVLLLTANVFADRVILTNGDRLTGRIVRKDDNSLTIQTESAGTVTIKWSAVAEVYTDEPLSVTMKDGEVVEAKLMTAYGRILVVPVGEETRPVEKTELKTARVPSDQEIWEKQQKMLEERKLTDFWSGTFDTGFSLTAGNSDTRTFSAGFRAVRETPDDKFTAYANALQVRNSSSGQVRITAQSVWAGARLDMNVRGKWFAFSSADFEYNQPQRLDLRAVLGGGGGYHAIRKDRVTLDLTGGVTNNYERFSTGITRNSAELLLGQEAKIKLNNRSRMTNRLVFYPNLTRPGDFRALLDGSLQTDINSWLGWHLTVGNRYNSRPVSATEKNDFLMSTGLRFSFGRNRRK